MMTEILGILIAALLSQNFILVKFYGICPFMVRVPILPRPISKNLTEDQPPPCTCAGCSGAPRSSRREEGARGRRSDPSCSWRP